MDNVTRPIANKNARRATTTGDATTTRNNNKPRQQLRSSSSFGMHSFGSSNNSGEQQQQRGGSSTTNGNNARTNSLPQEEMQQAMKFARMGLLSQNSYKFYASQTMSGEGEPDDDLMDELEQLDKEDGEENDDGKYIPKRTSSSRVAGKEAEDSPTQVDQFEATLASLSKSNSFRTIQSNMKSSNLSNAEIRSASKGIMSKMSMMAYGGDGQRLSERVLEELGENGAPKNTDINEVKKGKGTSRRGSVDGNNSRSSAGSRLVNAARRDSMGDNSQGSSWDKMAMNATAAQEQQQRSRSVNAAKNLRRNASLDSANSLRKTTLSTIASGVEYHAPQPPPIAEITLDDLMETTSIRDSAAAYRCSPNSIPQVDILTEGQHYLSISMLVYMYSHLRETCRMGHTRVKLEEIDVNSFQSLYGRVPPEEEALAGKMRYLDKTKSSGGIIRIVIDELGCDEGDNGNGDVDERKGQHQDLMGGASREYEKSIMKEFIKWIEDSKVSQLDASTEEAINNLRRMVARRRWKRAYSMVRIGRMLGRGLSDKSMSSGGNSTDQEHEEKESNMSPNQAQMVHHLRRKVARYRWKRAISRVIIAIQLSRPCKPNWERGDDESVKETKKVSPNIFVDMKILTNEVLQKQPKFFRDGSVMNNLIESGIEVVWFSDMTQQDVVYGILIQREEKRVTVVFRGTVNSHDWLINCKYGTNQIPNPINDDYPNRTDLLDIHNGFSLYMLRKRKDTQMNKIEEIFQKIDAIGREMAPDGGYKLSITGHSLGGALATLLGFYVAASEKFVNVKQVRVYTFAAPRVGTSSFIHAYQHMERIGKIRHGRFSCQSDIVPNIPFCTFDGFKPWRWKYYKHVGMRVQLHGVGRVAKWKLRRALDVTYPLWHDWISEIRRVFTNNIFANVTSLSGFKRNHTLTEYQKRVHFASQYRLALGKSIFFHDSKRNRMKSLDDYYKIRANISTHGASTMTDNVNPSSPRGCQWERNQRKTLVMLIVMSLLLFWSILVMALINSFTSDGSAAGHGHATVPRSSAFDALSEMPMAVNHIGQEGAPGGSEENRSSLPLDVDAQLHAAESKSKPLKEYATGVMFDPKLDEGLYLVGAGVRKKSIIKIYAVAMYSSPAVLNSVSSATLGHAARTFDSQSPTTSFVLEMVYSVGAEKIAGAIAESVKPRYSGSLTDINTLEYLIIEGVNKIGGQATKGTLFRFDCSAEGVNVSVNGKLQGVASFEGLGSAFVDVFMDDNAVSPTLVNSCFATWSSEEAKLLAASLLEFSQPHAADESGYDDEGAAKEEAVADEDAAKLKAVESELKPMQEYYTSVTFDPKLDEGIYLVGVGVRKKSIIKIYAVAMYSSATVLDAASSSALGFAARTFDSSTPTTSFVLEMVYSVGAEKIASAIAESVKPRYSGSPSNVEALESLIVEGVNKIGGQAIKGTVFRFDCSTDGVSVTVDGALQGIASFDGLGSAFVDVFMDGNAVSPTLVDSCLTTWSSNEAKQLAASLLEFAQSHAAEESGDVNQGAVEGEAGAEEAAAKLKAVESELKPIQEYYTSVTFNPKLDGGLYFVGAGVRKKSIIKIYAVAMYASAAVLNAASSTALGFAARTFDSSTLTTSFVLEMVYSVGAEKIASAIAESVEPRYSGSLTDINVLEALIVEGVNKIGGQATKGTMFRFDCSKEGVRVSVDGTIQGFANFDGLGSAFVDVFMDDNAVSPTLVDSCFNTWSGGDAKLLSASLLEFSQPHVAATFGDNDDVADNDQSEVEDAAVDGQAIETERTQEGGETLDAALTSPESSLKEETQALEDGEIVVYESDNTNAADGEGIELPSPTLGGSPPPKEADLSPCVGSSCQNYNRMQLARSRARDSFTRQRESVLDAVESIHKSGSIHSKASELAAQRLHILASNINEDDTIDISLHEPLKKVLRMLFPAFQNEQR